MQSLEQNTQTRRKITQDKNNESKKLHIAYGKRALSRTPSHVNSFPSTLRETWESPGIIYLANIILYNQLKICNEK